MHQCIYFYHWWTSKLFAVRAMMDKACSGLLLVSDSQALAHRWFLHKQPNLLSSQPGFHYRTPEHASYQWLLIGFLNKNFLLILTHSRAAATAFDLLCSLCGPSLPSTFVFFQTNSHQCKNIPHSLSHSGAFVFAVASAADAPSLLHSFMPVGNIHSFLGPCKNDSSSKKSWENIIFSSLEDCNTQTFCNYFCGRVVIIRVTSS